MNRRELFQQLAATATVAIPNPAIFLEGASVPVLAVFQVDGYVTSEMAARIRETWDRAIAGTSYAHVKAIVLGQGIHLELLDQHGHVNGSMEAE